MLLKSKEFVFFKLHFRSALNANCIEASRHGHASENQGQLVGTGRRNHGKDPDK